MSESDEIDRQIAERKKLLARPSRARYNKVHAALDGKWRRRELRPERMMREIVDALWDEFAGEPYSWVGFYLPAPNGQELILGAHRDKPACSPLPLNGVCGTVFKTGQGIVVADVKALGSAHIECDPKNLSEVCVPAFDKDGKVLAVLDVDSERPAAFDEMDQRWLERILSKFREIGLPS